LSADLPLSPEDVAQIVAILDRTPYERIDIRCSRFSLAVARSGDGWVQSWEWPEGAAGAVGPASDVTERTLAESPRDASEPEGLRAVRALLPGTFYRAPQPGAPAFVEVGGGVGPETVVGLIETMKLMTPVHAGVSGVIAAILVENAAVVAAGAALLHVAPSAT
jgi:acetyl-CoA carboxylase biotin carboxyl carrier protein